MKGLVNLSRIRLQILILGCLVFLLVAVLFTSQALASPYGSGAYNTSVYNGASNQLAPAPTPTTAPTPSTIGTTNSSGGSNTNTPVATSGNIVKTVEKAISLAISTISSSLQKAGKQILHWIKGLLHSLDNVLGYILLLALIILLLILARQFRRGTKETVYYHGSNYKR